VLKANKSSAEATGSGLLRNVLVVAQFSVSIGLIICTAVVYAQTVYARTADPGYRRDGLIQVENLGRRQLLDRTDAIAREMARVPGVVAVGRSGIGIATDNNNNTYVQVPGRREQVTIGNYSVDAGFFRTMGIELVAGRIFEEGRTGDMLGLPYPPEDAAEDALVRRGVNIVVNQLAAQRMGFRDPATAVGKTVSVALVDPEDGVVPARIIGVVRDSRFRSIRELYQAEAARAKVFAGFAILAVIVACLGLFGLAAFTADRRTKEIGIRKVMGARTRDIVRLLAWQFSKPVLIANLIAWPFAWWVMRDWLNNFDARIDLGPLPFVIAGALALAIAIGTIAGHAFRVARANPIHALRYE
jgi:putative ABC transport system permease protein